LSLKLRQNKYHDLMERVSVRIKCYFSHFLNHRDYAGTIRFNHEKQRLEINVKTDRHTSHSKATKNPKALSGGERSFTTVCFIISLWEAIEAPFRCLDEFDVFMVHMFVIGLVIQWVFCCCCSHFHNFAPSFTCSSPTSSYTPPNSAFHFASTC